MHQLISTYSKNYHSDLMVKTIYIQKLGSLLSVLPIIIEHIIFIQV